MLLWPYSLLTSSSAPFTRAITHEHDERAPALVRFLLFSTPARTCALRDPAHHTASTAVKQGFLSVIDYIATLPDLWQIGVYVLLFLLVIGLVRSLPIIFEFLWYVIEAAFELILKYLWYGTRYIFGLAFRLVSILWWRMLATMGIERKRDATPQEQKQQLDAMKVRAERFLEYYARAVAEGEGHYEDPDESQNEDPQLYGEDGRLIRDKVKAKGNDERNEAEEKPEPEPTTDPFKELDAMIGLHPVKHQIKHLANLVKVQNLRVKAGLPVPDMSHHLVFVGNPGTGKTTVARLVGRIFKDLSILKKGHLIETDRAGMIGEFIGHTAPKVVQVAKKAMDGVLFIDEAYTLTIKGAEKDFGPEAIATLITLMENHRDRLVVIAAGYPDEMRRFIDSNPGLKSRFKNFIHFPDYSPDELFQIFLKICHDGKYSLTPEAEEKLALKIEELSEERGKGFGNARAMRNLFEQSLTQQAKRILALGTQAREDLEILDSEDIPDIQANS